MTIVTQMSPLPLWVLPAIIVTSRQPLFLVDSVSELYMNELYNQYHSVFLYQCFYNDLCYWVQLMVVYFYNYNLLYSLKMFLIYLMCMCVRVYVFALSVCIQEPKKVRRGLCILRTEL